MYLGANAKSIESHITFSSSDFIYDSQSGTIKGNAVLNDINAESHTDNIPSTEDTAESTAHTYTANNTSDGYNWVTDGGVLIYNSNNYVLPSISNEKIEEYKEKYGSMPFIIDMTYSGAVPVYSNLQIEI